MRSRALQASNHQKKTLSSSKGFVRVIKRLDSVWSLAGHPGVSAAAMAGTGRPNARATLERPLRSLPDGPCEGGARWRLLRCAVGVCARGADDPQQAHSGTRGIVWL